MKIKFFTSLLIFVSICGSAVKAEETNIVEKQTLIYSIKGTDTLRIDKYDAPTGTGEKPCLIFVFGGGFAAGTRDDSGYLHFYEQLAKTGYVVVAIDYRLGLKSMTNDTPSSFDMTKVTMQMVRYVIAFRKALKMAVEDLFDATRYVVEHAAEWQINPTRIVTCGSSAGAITVLQGEYEVCNRSSAVKHLPQDFKYAGVISFAGAIFTTNGKLEWAEPPAPILLFHGDADKDVPYGAIRFGPLGFYGSKPIAEKLSEMKFPSYFYAVKGAGHRLSTTPMTRNWGEISFFLENFVTKKEKQIINTQVVPIK
jgi:dienelactone hydrolase